MANENRAAYRYTADEQREMDRLRQRYSADVEANNLSDMRDTDRQVTLRATIRAVAFGTAGALVFGAGLSMVLAWNGMVPGIVIGCCGIAVMASIPAVYERLLRRERRRAAEQMTEQLGEVGTKQRNGLYPQ